MSEKQATVGTIEFAPGYRTGAPYPTQGEKERIISIVIAALKDSPELLQALISAINTAKQEGRLK